MVQKQVKTLLAVGNYTSLNCLKLNNYDYALVFTMNKVAEIMNMKDNIIISQLKQFHDYEK